MSRTARLAALPLTAAIVLGSTSSAMAIGQGDPGDPTTPNVNQAPTAALTVSPNPALVSTQLLVQAQAARVIGLQDVLGRNAVRFDASGSSDPDGSIAKYEWDLDGNGTYEKTTTTAKTSRSYSAPGLFTVRVRVTDDGAKRDVATTQLRIHRAPRAAIAAAPSQITVGQKSTLSAAGSSDDDGIAKYEWDLDGNGSFETNTATSPTVQAPFTTVGSRTVRVRVTDVYNASSTASTTVGVHPVPVAAYTASPSPAVVGEQVVFDGTGSIIGEEPIVKFEWDLDGDGTFETDTGARPQAARQFTAPGTIATNLRITDRQGAQDVETRNLTVLAQAPLDTTAPIVRITAPSTRISLTGRVTLTVACPAGERLCTGRVTLRSRSARSAAIGSRAFRLGGGQRAQVRVLLAGSARRAVKRNRRLSVRVTVTARDAAGNNGVAIRTLRIRR